MTTLLFRKDAYLKRAPAKIDRFTENGGIILDQTIFYPTSGGQLGDTGRLTFENGESCEITSTIKDDQGNIILVPKLGGETIKGSRKCEQQICWANRYKMMKMHTTLHILSVVIPLPVTGGQISPLKGRLDFDMPEAPASKFEIEEELNKIIGGNYSVTEEWITDQDLMNNPSLVKTMSVKPPIGNGTVRLIRISDGNHLLDLQPCGGTHVKLTSEIGEVGISKIEKKGRQNRRVSVLLK